MKKILLILIALIVTGIFWYIQNSGKTGTNAPSVTIVPVDAGTVIRKDTPYSIELAGITQAFKSVQVKSLVTGEIIKVHFQEGGPVKEGDLLFELDDRNFQYQLQQAEANLLRDEIQLENAKKEEERYRILLEQKAVSEEEYLAIKTTMNAMEATVRADKAVIENTRLQIEYCKITATIDGRPGEIILDEGNVAVADNQTLAVINQISPIYTTFSLSEKHLNALRKLASPEELAVTVKTSSGEEIKYGSITFIDNEIDTTTGTVKLKALFPNSDETLWPGQFVRIFVNIYNKKGALVIPSKALQTNQEGSFVFVIGADNKVKIRKISVEFADDNNAVIAEGLIEGEKIVTGGQSRLNDESLVEVKE